MCEKYLSFGFDLVPVLHQLTSKKDRNSTLEKWIMALWAQCQLSVLNRHFDSVSVSPESWLDEAGGYSNIESCPPKASMYTGLGSEKVI